jgi:hypothetical protein
VLDVQLSDKVSRRGISALRKLSSLKEFLFYNWLQKPNLVEQIGFCFKLLPHLHTVADKGSVLGYRMGLALSSVQSPCILQLRHLAVYNLNHIPAGASLPEVQVLHLDVCVDNMQLQIGPGRFPKLIELNWIVTSNEDYLMVVLGHLGLQLQTLRFRIFRGGTLHLDRVLGACPQLSQLEISTNARVLGSAELGPDTLSRLQTLSLTSSRIEPGLLLQILRLASHLRSVNLKVEKLDAQELREWAELAKEGTCMQHLQQIKLTFSTSYFDEHKHLLDEVFISCSIHCPQLKHFALLDAGHI